MMFRTIVFCAVLTAIQFNCIAQQKNTMAADPAVEAKIDRLLAKMTLEEKAGQMRQVSRAGEDGPADIENEIAKGNIGSFLNIADVELRNRLQKTAVEKSRLGIPLIFGFDVIHGLRTIYPVPLGEAASWDIELMEKTAAMAAAEARAVGIDWTFSPMVDIARDPRWGRIVEGAGEDPYLGALIARAKVRGYQGRNLADPNTIAACLKHFAVYGASQAGRDYHTVEVPIRAVRDIYLPPFEAGVRQGAATLMCAFNDIDGIPASSNKFLLTDVLRDQWGFEGFVVSDWRSIRQLIYHGVAKDLTDAAILSAQAGLDMEMVSLAYCNLPALVRQGVVSETTLDTAVRRILRVKYKLGLFDEPYVSPERQKSIILSPQNRALARQAVRQSLVLLKNQNNILPLSKNIKSIALIGPLADSRRDMLGTWCLAGKDEDVITVRQGLKDAVGKTCKINYAKGCDADGDSKDDFAKAIDAAKKSDVVIMTLGEPASYNGEAHSRTNINLPAVQLELLKEIAKTGKPIVMLLFTGRPLTINWELENIPAILLAWHPGIEAGSGIADVLFGDYNPSGKLTVTFPRSVGQIPIYYNVKNVCRPFAADDVFTSRYIDSSNLPLLPFGYGISYTTFKYSSLKIENTQIKIPGIVRISADITNTGKLAGVETAQLYVADLVASVTRPVKELKGFRRVHLNAGETKTVTFDLPTDDLKFWDVNMQYTVEPGDFKIWVGADSAGGLEGSFTLL